CLQPSTGLRRVPCRGGHSGRIARGLARGRERTPGCRPAASLPWESPQGRATAERDTSNAGSLAQRLHSAVRGWCAERAQIGPARPRCRSPPSLSCLSSLFALAWPLRHLSAYSTSTRLKSPSISLCAFGLCGDRLIST